MAILKPGRPPGWDEPRLPSFLESMWANVVATFANKKESHRLCRIDDLMFEIARDWKGRSPTARTIVPLMMYFRAHSAFRAAAGLGMGGATVEEMAVLRLALEFAGYACLVNQDPSLADVWWDRDVDKAKEKEARGKFTHSAVVRSVKAVDATLGGIYETLYDQLIQFGGHPNEKTISGSLKLDVTPEQTLLSQVYLQGDGHHLDHSIHTANQIGICILKIFEKVHPARFEALKAGPRIDALAKGL